MSACKRPNVLLIVADDMGYGDFGVFSEGRVRTPQLDRLVGEGICLQQHYSASPICSPARAGLLTGRYPHRTGAITQHDMFGLDRIARRERTIADVFRRADYATALKVFFDGGGRWRYRYGIEHPSTLLFRLPIILPISYIFSCLPPRSISPLIDVLGPSAR